MIRIFSLVFILFQLLVPQSPRFERIGIEQGLSQSSAMAIIQDREGFLWVGTWDGLNRYDGYSFVQYRHDHLDSNSISSNSIHYIFEDRDGFLWIGTAGGGLNRFDKKNNSFTNKFNHDTLHSGQALFSVSYIGQDSAGFIWSSNAMELERIEPRTFSIRKIRLDTIRSTTFSRRTGERGLTFVAAKRLITTTPDGSVLAQELFTDPRERDKMVNGIYYYRTSDGVILVYSPGVGIYEFDWNTNNAVLRYSHSNDPHSLSSNFVRRIFEDSRGTLWVGTDQGLNKALYDQRHTIIGFERILSDPADNSTLSSDEINSIYEDRTGVLWFGTKIGLNKLLPRRKDFIPIPEHHSIQEFAGGSFPVGVYEASDSLVWIGTTAGLNLYNTRSDTWKKFTTANSGLSNNTIHNIFKDSRDRFWFLTRYGLNRYDESRSRFIQTIFDAESPYRELFNKLYAIAEDEKGILWIGSARGLIRFDPQSGTHRRISFDTLDNGLGNTYVLSLLSAGKQLWIGTNTQGLLSVNTDDLSFQRYVFDEKDDRSISNNKQMWIHRDRSGTIWVATLGGGLNKVIQEGGNVRFQRYQGKEGMLNDNLYGILEDDHENLWLSTNYGISKFSMREERFTNYTTADGLPTLEYNQNSFHRGKSGYFYFGGINGMVRFKPERIGSNTIPPKIAVTKFSIFNEQHDEKLNVGTIELAYTENFFSFEFSALDFEASQKNQYAYKLEGFEPDWNAIGTRRFASFTNVPPGGYTFRVKGSNNDGVWNNEGRSIKILIVPPFWATVWFRLLSVTLFIGAIVGSVRYSAYRKYRRQIDELEHQKRILEERQRTRDKIARDLHDDLASTVGSAGLFIETAKRTMGEDSAQAKEYLDKTSSILSEAEEAMSDIVWSVSPKHDTLQSLSTRIRLVTTELCRANGIGYAVDVKGDTDVPLSEEIRRGLYLIFKEVLNNCLKHSHATKIEILIGSEGNNAVLQVSDNGTGLPMEGNEDRLGGNGMHNISKRAEEIGATISITSVRGSGVTVRVEKQLTQLSH
ncbi:MAG: ligand-binding sensor domain-containing protein [Bacteroidota bacterium]